MLHTHTHTRYEFIRSFFLSLVNFLPLPLNSSPNSRAPFFFSRLLARRHNKFPESKVHEAIPPPTLSVRDITSGTFQYLSMSRLEKHPLDASRIKIVFHDIFQILNSNNYDSYLGWIVGSAINRSSHVQLVCWYKVPKFIRIHVSVFFQFQKTSSLNNRFYHRSKLKSEENEKW